MDRYRTFASYIRETFKEPLYKICIDGGFTCPNRDGTLSSGGCTFCSGGGSGEFCSDRALSIRDQLKQGRDQTRAKHRGRYIAYFQAFTGTYAPAEKLEEIYRPALEDPDVAVISIATRPDCLPDRTLDLLQDMNRRKPVWVELGLQTCHDRTALMINRCYPTALFADAVKKLNARGIRVIAHLILGLPEETEAMQLESVDYINALPVSGIKFSMLYLLKGTVLGEQFLRNPFPVFTPETYTDTLLACIKRLRPDIVVERMTGDAPRHLLIAPRWHMGKGEVLNRIRHEMKVRDIRQGSDWMIY